MNTKYNYSLLKHNTFGINVAADTFFEYSSVEELSDFITTLRHTSEEQKPILHIGEGSNLLFLDNFNGVILHSQIKNIQRISERKNVIVLRVGSGLKWDDFVAYCTLNGFCGIENLSGIPGEVGASAVQNIGAYGVEAADTILRVEVVDLETGKKRLISKKDCQYGYRNSIFKNEYKGRYAVTYVHYKLSKKFVPNLSYKALKTVVDVKYERRQLTPTDIRKEVIHLRDEKLPDPNVLGNAGSFFMNPVVGKQQLEQFQKEYTHVPFYEIDEERVKIPAAWLIEQCGWKGKILGTVGVYSKQPLVLVNCGGATGRDVADLAAAVSQSVHEKFGIDLHPEVNFIAS
ncbi:UDP-N-acetylmuramate dehydrogenase [Bacteroides sp. OF04-15BH]|jgi:UDP-N-acetylmuramate dehydrogenase|uniref:UDP-N-acetylmuramate dehydrogenase n=1 Tax=Bacteroides sp. OF04-15BH TaxID=2292281 RepID=UPI000E513795|nr:UDP-N-acetylmuramate dehydrogenase [Bacteroides sp. OF04-15BH]RHP64595.1 UDP-N-acetylmuramate dehydrogenase [Bacteroides sp. OF04-15BH]